jgi:acyl carrier protein
MFLNLLGITLLLRKDESYMMKFENEIRDIVANIITLTMPINDVKIDTDFRNIGMDSLSFINLIGKIEDVFGIEFPDEKLIMEESSTIEKLCNIVDSCIKQ